jgi:hypothetical protein
VLTQLNSRDFVPQNLLWRAYDIGKTMDRRRITGFKTETAPKKIARIVWPEVAIYP